MTSSNKRLILPIVLLACLYLAPKTTGTSAGSGKHRTVRSESSAALRNSRHLALASLLRRRRSMKENLWGGPPYNSYFADKSNSASSPTKRNEDAWIWMPAYGYVPMPTDDSSNSDHDNEGEGIGTLFRYG